MKKIIHLSDLHVGFPNMSERLGRVVRDIVFLKEPSHDYVIVVTGDLVESAFNSESYVEVKAHLDVLTTAGFTVLTVPGNHDYGNGSLAQKKYVDEFKKTFFEKTTVAYPKLDIVDDTAFIGLDSMAEEVHWYDCLWANGELGPEQLGRLSKVLASDEVSACNRVVVYLHHHPFDPNGKLHELKDSDALRKAITRPQGKRVDALLYGHNHEGKIRNGKWGISRCYDAGSSTHKLGSVGPLRVIDFRRDPREDYDGGFGGV